MAITPNESEAQHKARAATLWAKFDKNQKAGVRFGLFPMKEMASVEAEGFDTRLICAALMDCAKSDGGMRA